MKRRRYRCQCGNRFTTYEAIFEKADVDARARELSSALQSIGKKPKITRKRKTLSVEMLGILNNFKKGRESKSANQNSPLGS